MSNQLGLEYIDLTEKTIDLNIEMGNDARYLYAYTGAKKEGDNLVPKGLDKTHTNLYGAKRNAYLIANADTTLKKYSKKREYPVKEDFFEDAVNKDYKVIDYITTTEESKNWPEFLDVEGNVFTGSVFGNVGGEDKITGGDFEVFKSDKSINLTVKNNRGKIASNVDGIMMYYKRLPANTEFILKAKVIINDIAKNDQVSFGLMARDDMYVDRSITDSIGDYVVAGSRMQGKINGFGRKNSKLYDGGVANIIYQKGDELDLTLTKTQDGYMVKYGENEPVSAGFDYPLTQIDSEYIYVGFFVARNANITFSDVSLKYNVDNEKNKAGEKIIPDTPSKNNNITEEKPKGGLPNDSKKDQNTVENHHQEVAEHTKVSDNKNNPVSDDGRVVIPKNSNSKAKNRRSSSSSGSSSKGSKKVFHNTFTGWKTENVNGHNVWKYVENGKNVTSQWAYIFNPYTNRNAWFKFDKDGVMETGWINENGINYYLSEISDGSLGEWIKK